MRYPSTPEAPPTLSYRAVVLGRLGAAIGAGAAGFSWMVNAEPQVALLVASTITWLATIPVLRRVRHPARSN